MAFTESLKELVRKKAMFRCCRCQNVGIDVHHIVPQKDCGSDDLDNAAPLCQNCHDQFGDNPSKRKEITQMRDNWYERAAKMWPDQSTVSLPVLEDINKKLEDLRKNQGDLAELKVAVKKLSDRMIDNMSLSNATVAVSGLVDTAMAASSVKLGDKVHANFSCSSCGTKIGLLIGRNSCPNCGREI